MYTPPFHRRILPWIFIIMFVACAPVVVFYTAGYRWNPLKEKIERNGTVIFDTSPVGARILLNGKDSGYVTPRTIQNVSPGTYQIRYELEGYRPWEKRLDVLPERVTFANDVRLWKDGNLLKVEDGVILAIEPSPNGRNLVMVVVDGTSSTRIDVRSSDLSAVGTFNLNQGFSAHPRVTWSLDSRAFIIETSSEGVRFAWLVNVRTGLGPIALPSAIYRWNGSVLEGNDGTSLVSIDAGDGSIVREPFAFRVVDTFEDLTLRTATTTNALVLFRNGDPMHGFILPSGDWTIVTLTDGRLILRDGSSWLSVGLENDTPDIVRATGDALRSFTEKGSTSYLLVSDGEIWRWDEGKDAELLMRESREVVDAVWHADGRDLAFANGSETSMLNLDGRDGRIRTLFATFTSVSDITLVDTDLLVCGEKDGQTGLWRMTIE
ncbi:PEGA domain-containing protein [Patescibacteria group bacterium]|nr:PEGA domain-containing protein [Patescibacteria group bacterium]